jgi:aminomuconate-semialdehyde/2-hydroxymuconate-6-semialdehyde dehydrogenase
VRQFRNFIAGKFVETDRQFDNINPADGTRIGRIHAADASVVDRAVAAGKTALAGPWGNSGAEARAAMLERIADGIDARFAEFVAAEVADTGRPISVAETLDVPRGAANFRTFAALLRADGGESFESNAREGAGTINYAIRRPLGVVAAIMPWNLPLLSISWKAAPAMACGNVVVAKPSEETPATATLLAEVMQCSGVPDGVFNLVHGHGETGAAMTSHSGVNAISFTGETSTGEAIMRNAAAGVRPVSFELGGKNPAIVFADCDFDAAVAGVARSSFFNTGQVCLCTERVYVERAIFDRFVVALAGAARAMRIGDPLDRKTNMGPLISQGHRKRVLSYYDLALDEGATLVTGGCVPAGLDSGSFVEPTVWIGLGNDARCLQEEIFGPVCHVMPFDEEAEAITLANDSRFGLAASVWTGNVQRAVRVAGTVDVGLTWINGWFVRDLRTPFGGGKLSGIGREGGRHSFDFYSEIRNICIAL